MGHEKVSDNDCCRFWVAMHGSLPEGGKEQLWTTKRNFVANGAQELIDKHAQVHANYPPCSDLLVPKLGPAGLQAKG